MNEGENAGASPPSPPAFSEPTAAPPGWQAPPGMTPHLQQGPYWVSFDRQHWWNGAMWVPGPPPGPPGPAYPNYAPGGVGPVATIVGLIFLGLFAIFALGICMSMQQPGIPPPIP